MQWQLLCLSHSEIVIARSLSDWFCFSRSKSLHCRTLKSPYFSLPQIFKAPVFEGVNTSALFDATCTRIKTVEVSFKNFKSCTWFRSWLMFWFLLLLYPNMKVGPEFVVSSDCEVAALDLETLPRSEVGKVDSEFRLIVSKANCVNSLCSLTCTTGEYSP